MILKFFGGDTQLHKPAKQRQHPVLRGSFGGHSGTIMAAGVTAGFMLERSWAVLSSLAGVLIQLEHVLPPPPPPPTPPPPPPPPTQEATFTGKVVLHFLRLRKYGLDSN